MTRLRPTARLGTMAPRRSPSRWKAVVALAWTAAVTLASAGQAGAPKPASGPALHAPFDTLLQRYVTGDGVQYARWKAARTDRAGLSSYVDRLEAQSPSQWPPDHALAYWIDLYNAATLELVLEHYPVKSIRDIGGPDGSPWKRKLVRVEGRELTLDEIEHDVVRKRFEDARIHFALNCAAIGCPPLASRAFTGDSLSAQLDAACRRVLNDARWVRITEKEMQLTRLFDWYREDFERAAGSVPAFLARYRGAGANPSAGQRTLTYLEYAWDLNEVR